MKKDIISLQDFVDLSIQRMKVSGREANLKLADADVIQTISRLL